MHLIAFAKRIPSVRPCVQSPMPFGFASPLGHVSQGASRMVGLGDVSCLDISVEPCQNPSRPVWEALTRLFVVRPGTVTGPQLFHRALLAPKSCLHCHSVTGLIPSLARIFGPGLRRGRLSFGRKPSGDESVN